MSEMTRAEIVEAMLDVLDSPEHWCKGLLTNGKGAYCLMGALNLVTSGDPYHWAIPTAMTQNVRSLAREMDNLATEKGYGNILAPILGEPAVNFNNAPDIEYEDLRLFLKEVHIRVEQ